jgi:two-component system chemotaxis response regulator CheB
MDLVAIGCSAGGLHALQVLLGGLDARLALPIVIVSHTASREVDMMCEILAKHSPFPVVEAEERNELHAGLVYVAPSGYHLLIDPDRRFSLSIDPKVCFVRPSIDVLFASAADVYRDRLTGVVLTGANHDGAHGLQRIRSLGGMAIVQDPHDAEVPTMPQAALDAAGSDYCLQLIQIAPQINRMCLP